MRNTKDGELEIDLLDLLRELLSRWYILLAAIVLCAGIATGYKVAYKKPVYASTSVLYVLNRSAATTSLADVQIGTNLTNDYLEVATCRPVLEQVLKNLGLPETHIQLRNNITVTNPRNTRFLQITVRDLQAQRAKMIADEIASVVAAFIAEKMDQDPPSLVQSGYDDGAPIGWSTARYALVGAAAGLLLATAVITVLWMFNDTLMIPEDVEKKTGLRVIGVLPYTNVKGL